jgi:serpin B
MNRVLIFFVLPVIVTGCSDSPSDPDPFDVRALPQEVMPYADDVVISANEFAIDIYKEIVDEDGNLFCSPFSIACALSMTYAGAAGTTATEMSRVLHVRDEEHWHDVFGALQASLNRGADLEGYELSLSNRIWPQEGFSFLETFISTLTDLYDSGVEFLDFMTDPEAARVTINDWVEAQTNGRIKDLLRPGTVSDITRLVLTNAIYFKGTWLYQFDPDETYEGPFTLSDGSAVTTPLMIQKDISLDAGIAEDAQILLLPFEGEDISMIFVLPHDKDGLRQVEENLEYDQLTTWIESAHERSFDTVIIPVFGFTSDFSLAQILAATGMPSAFSPEADFSGMTGSRDLFINAVVHKAFVEVNEEGAEAAAATAVGMNETSVGPAFVADHPFLFLLYDHVTGAILFMGRVENPTLS